MVGIQGLGGIPEPRSEKTDRARNDRDAAANAARAASEGEAPQDGVVISSEAQAAARVARIIAEAKLQSEIRPEKVEAARQRIEQGDYRNPEVVRQVAERLQKFLS
jgi:anti-sigma28 factor (negative regulator of flagellin synthesis)